MSSPSAPSPSPAPPSPALNGDDLRRSLPNAITLARVLLSIAFFGILLGYHWEPLGGGGAAGEGGGAAGKGGVHWRLVLAAVVFTLAAVTDALDGYLARKWKAVSIFGRIMDPFADKFLVLGALAFLAAPGFYWVAADASPLAEAAADAAGGTSGGGLGFSGGGLGFSGGGGRGVFVSGVHPWMVVAILGRELLVTSIRGVLEAQGVAFPATWSGKAKMILQSAVVPVVLFLLALPIHVVDGGGGAEGAAGAGQAWGFWTIQSLVWVTVVVSLWSGVPYITRAIAVTRPGRGGIGRNVERVIGEN